MRKFILLFPAFLLTLYTFSQYSLDSSWIRANYTKIEKMIPMRDGIKLFTAIYLPNDKSDLHPILITRTPYSCSPYGESKFPDYFHQSYHRNYLRKNYIIVLQDVRGRFMSEGVFQDIRPFNENKKTNADTDEASDTYDTIEWLTKNLPSNNNKAGVFGISYPGFYSSMASMSGHPSLKAVSPQAPVTEWFIGDDFHHNGAMFVMDAFAFYTGFGVPHPTPSTTYSTGYTILNPDNYDFYLKTGALKNFTKLTGDTIAFWKELMTHPDYDAWWQTRNVRSHVEHVQPAMLNVGGLFDAEDCFGAWRFYEAVEQKKPKDFFNKIVMGPWFHGQWGGGNGSSLGNIQFGSNTSEFYQNEIELPFFEYFLRGKGDISSLPEATIFLTGKNEWRKFEQWPPSGTTNKNLYLQPGGKLDWTKPADGNASSEYISDPAKPVPYADNIHSGRTREYMNDDQRFASRRTDVLSFETGILDEDLTVTGTVIADLMVSISTTDADFVVKIIDAFPENFKYEKPENAYPMGGYQMLVRGEIMRGRYRNSFEKPVAFVPGKPEHVKFELPDIAHTFKKGHRVMVQIQSSWFPLADRNPQQFINIYQADDKDFIKTSIKIHHNSKNSSAIMLPVLP